MTDSNPNQSNIEYDDVYVVEERPMPVNDAENIEDEELNEELSLSMSSASSNIDLGQSDFDKLKLESEKSKRKLEEKKEKEKTKMIQKVLQEKLDFKPKTIKRDEVVEDYIRNFFIKHKLNYTLEVFNQEFSELYKKGKFNDNYLGPISDVHIKNAKLQEKLDRMKNELKKANKNAEIAKSKWESLRKERDFHKENYFKTVGEKETISNDIKVLEKLHNDFTSKIADLNLKYEHLCKNKSLLKLDLEKLTKEKARKEKEIIQIQEEISLISLKSKKEGKDVKIAVLPYKKTSTGEKSPWPSDIRNNLFLLQNCGTFSSNPNQGGKVIKAYEQSASCMTVHIKKNVVATGGDDSTFKIYDMSKGEELASGGFHTQYISSIDIHPKGSYLATASGDYTINLWDLLSLKIKAQFSHSSVVWSCKFHDTGDFLLTSNDEGFIKLYDLNTCSVRSTYKGHTDSVNKVNFQPFTNYFASCSSDKSISIWDMRLGLTVQTFYGHLNSINDVVFNARGDMLYSCDADGIIKAWDIRKVSEYATWVHYPHVPANCLEAEKTNNYLYVGYDNGYIGVVNIGKKEIMSKIKAHGGPVNGIGINLTNNNMFTVGGDGNLITWQ